MDELCRVVHWANKSPNPASFEIKKELSKEKCKFLHNSNFTRGMFVDTAVLAGVLKIDYSMEYSWNCSEESSYIQTLMAMDCTDWEGNFDQNISTLGY